MMAKKLKTAAFVRISRHDPPREEQIAKFTELAKTHGLEITQIYEQRMTNARRARPHYLEMLADAEAGKFQVLLLWSLEKLGKNLMPISERIGLFEKWGVRVISWSEQWCDFYTERNRAQLTTIFTWIAGIERKRAADAAQEGVEKAIRKGTFLGRPKTEFDMDVAIRMRKEGNTIQAVAKELGVHYTTLYRRFAKEPNAGALLGNQSASMER